MKLVLINDTGIKVFHFNSSDTQKIKEQCKAAKKAWSDQLLGFFIYATKERTYAAVTIKEHNEIIGSMEYLDIERNTPEFNIDNNFLSYLTAKDTHTEIDLEKFDTLFTEILFAPQKARRWEVYPEISKLYLGH